MMNLEGDTVSVVSVQDGELSISEIGLETSYPGSEVMTMDENTNEGENTVVVVVADETVAASEPAAVETKPAKPAKAPKVKKVGGHNNSYPFQTRAQILARVATDDDFMKSALVILFQNQTADEAERKDTIYKNKRGFMSSHAAPGTELATKLIGGEELTADQLGKARSIALRYGRQLAEHFRAEQLTAQPELAAIAKTFGVAS